MSPQEPSITAMQLSLETSALEAAYGKACRQVEIVCESENARQLQLQTMVLEDENEELHTQLGQADERIDELERYVKDIQEDVEVAMGKFDSVQGDLRIRNREIETLKAELTSLSGVTMDSTKLLTEKLTLARELSALRPELDHLQSQASSSQSLLGEKLSLQRHLNALQVELENEKRSTQRLAAKEGKFHTEDTKLEARLEVVQAELAKEKREKQNADREAQKSSAVLENKILMYESRLDAFRGKLKNTKESLKEMQSELQKSQAVNAHPAPTAVQSASVARNSRKRTASEMDADTMIGTPGDLPAAKKDKAKSIMPGEKSTFSITPFLNRTASLGPESPPQAEDKSNDEEEAGTMPQSPSKSRNTLALSKPALTKTAHKTSTQDEGDVGKKRTNVVAEKGKKPSARHPLRKAMAAPKLAQVDEEEASPFVTSQEAACKALKSKAIPDEKVNDGPETRKAKRKKLGGGLGKTLFDEDDGDALKADRRIGAARGFSTLGKGGLGGSKVSAGALGGFGPFSPLKKDRRAGAA